jgi:hypothetical protein
MRQSRKKLEDPDAKYLKYYDKLKPSVFLMRHMVLPKYDDNFV